MVWQALFTIMSSLGSRINDGHLKPEKSLLSKPAHFTPVKVLAEPMAKGFDGSQVPQIQAVVKNSMLQLVKIRFLAGKRADFCLLSLGATSNVPLLKMRACDPPWLIFQWRRVESEWSQLPGLRPAAASVQCGSRF